MKLLVLSAASFLTAAGSAAAHHGTSEYDMTMEVALTGTVKEWTFGNPHTCLWLNVGGAQGAAEEWSIESAPPNYLSRQGWTASTLQAGERLTILVSPRRGESRAGILLEVKRSNGETLIVRPRGSFGRPASID